MSDNKLNDIIATSLDSIREIADAGTIIGEPIRTNNGTVIIPVSKVSLGFASGGVDYLPKELANSASNTKSAANVAKGSAPGASSSAPKPSNGKTPYFGGGGGTGISISPVCFLVVKAEGDVEILNINAASSTSPAASIVESVSSFIERSPELISRLKASFGKKKEVDGLDDEVIKEAEAKETSAKEEQK